MLSTLTKTLQPKTLQCMKCHLSQLKPSKLDPNYTKDMQINQYVISPHRRKRVYVWGNMTTGALGIPQTKEKEGTHQTMFLKSPKRMHFAEKNNVLHVASGFGYTLFATENQVFGSGINAESQIGYHEMRVNKPLGLLFAPRSIHLDSASMKNAEILKITAGRAHSAVLTSVGLYLFGSNAYGQCGRKIIENEVFSGSRIINCLENMDGNKIVDVVCGQDHTLLLTEEGSVYSCGWGADGQTGLEHYKTTDTFTKLKGDISGEKITQLACRSDFVLALNDRKEVFGWGNTEYSQITLPDGTQQLARPTKLQPFEKIGKISSIATGGSFCLVLAEDGEVYVWGFGLLGLGPLVGETKIPTVIPRTLFGYNDFNHDSKVNSVHAGLSHMAAVTNKGDLYTWGRNRSACLGLGFENDQHFPLKVALGGFVKYVSCGLDHMIAICSSYIQE